EGSPNRLYRNLGDTLSRLEPVNIGLDSPDDESYSPIWGDYDNDGDMDLYVCNGEKNRLYENQGEGSFQDITEAAGVGGLFHTENAAWGDFDNDGFLDLYLANTNTQPNILYQNLGAGRFTEFTLSPIINDAGEGFAAAWGDYDNDGDLDLFLARAGYREHFLEGRGQVNRLFENQEGTFVDIAAAAGVADSLIATAAIWGDYDNDGFLDIFVAVRDERSKSNPAFSSANKLYRNSGGNGNNYLKILLHGTLSNANGIGAHLELHTGGQTQIREISGGEGRSHAGV
ncbi:MAG: VCBS repeat-containing protein, partial [Thermoanaerobaculia bacterium]|nr:VCBS repeat-containing protein [Thermoanaerobaculia bacterium]